MSAGKYNIEIEKKATYNKVFTYYSTFVADGDAGNVVYDLTGCTIVAAIKKAITDTSTILSFTTSIVDAEAGKFSISLSPAQTSSIAFDKGVYDIRVTFPGGDSFRVLEGNVVVSKGVA